MDGELWFGDGSIKRVDTGRRAGKWRLQWSHVDPSAQAGSPRVRVDRYFDRKAEAESWRDGRKVELRTGRAKAPSKTRALTFQAWFDQLAGTKDEEFADGRWVQDGAAPQTVGVKLSRWGKWVKGQPIAAVPVAALTRDHARAQVRGMKERGATHATVVDVVGVLKKVVNDAIRERREADGLLNPFERLPLRSHEETVLAAIEKQRREEEDGPDVVLISPKAACAALTRVCDPRRRAMIAVFLLGGLRLSEGMALTREQIDFERGVVLVDRAVKFGPTGAQSIGLPKRNKTRLVAMCPLFSESLRAHVETMPEGQRHLFPAASEDKPRMKKLFYATWRDIRKAAKLPARLLPQGCRASHNNWVEKLMPLVSESTRLEHMGHSVRRGEGQAAGIVVNLRNYTGYLPEGFEILRREIERVVAS